MSSSPVRSQAEHPPSDEEFDPASQVAFYTQAPYNKSSVNAALSTQSPVGETTESRNEALKAILESKGSARSWTAHRGMVSAVSGSHQGSEAGHVIAKGVTHHTPNKPVATISGSHLPLHHGIPTGTPLSSLTRSYLSHSNVGGTLPLEGFDTAEDNIQYQGKKTSPSDSEKENSQESRGLVSVTRGRSSMAGPAVEDSQKVLLKSADLLIHDKWDGLSRIPRRYVQIPRDQRSLLEQDGTWRSSFVGQVHPEVNLPDKVFARLQKFHRRRISDFLEGHSHSDRAAEDASVEPIPVMSRAGNPSVLDDSRHRAPGMYLKGGSRGPETSKAHESEPGLGDPTTQAGPRHRHIGVTELGNVTLVSNKDSAGGMPLYPDTNSNDGISLISWSESEAADDRSRRTSAQSLSPVLVSAMHVSEFSENSSIAPPTQFSPINANESAYGTSSVPHPSSRPRVSDYARTIPTSSPEDDEMDIAVPYSLHDAAEHEVLREDSPGCELLYHSTSSQPQPRLQVERTPHSNADRSAPPFPYTDLSSYRSDEEPRAALANDCSTSDPVIPGTFDVQDSGEAQTSVKLYLGLSADEHSEKSYSKFLGDGGEALTCAASHTSSPALQVPRSQLTEHVDGENVSSARTTLKRSAGMSTTPSTRPSKRRGIVKGMTFNLSQEPYSDPKELLRRNRTNWLRKVDPEDVKNEGGESRADKFDVPGSKPSHEMSNDCTLEQNQLSEKSQSNGTMSDPRSSPDNLLSLPILQDNIPIDRYVSHSEGPAPMEQVVESHEGIGVEQKSAGLKFDVSSSRDSVESISDNGEGDTPIAEFLNENLLGDGTDVVVADIWESYRLAYPLYDASLTSFIKACVYIEWLTSISKAPHRYLWDDFIRAFSTGYRSYVKHCKATAQEALPGIEYYNTYVSSPLFKKGIISPSNLNEVLSLNLEKTVEARRVILRKSEGRSQQDISLSSQEITAIVAPADGKDKSEIMTEVPQSSPHDVNAPQSLSHSSQEASIVGIGINDRLGNVTHRSSTDGLKKPFFETPSQLATKIGGQIKLTASSNNLRPSSPKGGEEQGFTVDEEPDTSSSFGIERSTTATTTRRLPWSSPVQVPESSNERSMLNGRIEGNVFSGEKSARGQQAIPNRVSISKHPSTIAATGCHAHVEPFQKEATLNTPGPQPPQKSRRKTTGTGRHGSDVSLHGHSALPEPFSAPPGRVSGALTSSVMSWEDFVKAHISRRKSLSGD